MLIMFDDLFDYILECAFQIYSRDLSGLMNQKNRLIIKTKKKNNYEIDNLTQRLLRNPSRLIIDL